MKKIIKYLFFCTLGAVSLAACNGSANDKCANDIDVSNIAVNAPIVRLEREIVKYKKSSADIARFMDKYPLYAEVFLQRKHNEQDSTTIYELMKSLNSPYLDTLQGEAEAHFGEMKDVQAELDLALKHVKYYFPDYKEPKMYSTVTGFSVDIFASDSMVIIGLDSYLSQHTRYRQQMLPQYIERRMQRNFIVPMLMMTTANKYMGEASADPASMIDNMIMWGKVYYFMEKMQPCLPDSVIAGYTSEEMKEVNQFQARIWSHFVEKKLFFAKDHFMVTKYVGERPHTFEIGDKCPGRIGRWLGWQIVRKFAEDTKMPLPELMKLKDHARIFQEAKYKPSNS
jgi:hypothetical protein